MFGGDVFALKECCSFTSKAIHHRFCVSTKYFNHPVMTNDTFNVSSTVALFALSRFSWELDAYLSRTPVSVAGTTWLITTLWESERPFCSLSGSTQNYSKQPQAQNKAKTVIPLLQCWLTAPQSQKSSQTFQTVLKCYFLHIQLRIKHDMQNSNSC